MERPMTALRLGADIAGASISAMVGVFAASDDSFITGGAIVAVLGFAGMLVRQIVGNQRIYIGIVEGKDREIREHAETIHYLRWEAETLRYQYGERAVSPGPYVPRHPATDPGAHP